MKTVLKAFVAVGFAAVAAIVGQVAWNTVSSSPGGAGWPALIFGCIGAVAGWYRVK